jgi:hypothetical protein
MINLVAWHPRTLKARFGDLKLGIMNTWVNAYSIETLVETGYQWALDNYCYMDYNPTEIRKALLKYENVPNNLFAVVPDVVGNAVSTTELWHEWIGEFSAYTPAYVIQDGIEAVDIPFGQMGALFIGGSNAFKGSDICRSLVKEALHRKLHVHAGRVNTLRRIRYFSALGCHTSDGTAYSRFADTYIRQHQPYRETQQWLLF